LRQISVPTEAFGRPELDLTDPSSVGTFTRLLRPTDTLVITSALTPDKGRDFRTLMTNLRMMEHVCEALDQRPCEHVIYLSSDAVYDAHKTPLDEDSSREPVDLYACMHTQREMMLESVLSAKRIPYCILRPVNIYGFGDTHNSYGPNRFVRQAFEAGKIALFGKGEERRNHLFIEDAARIISKCAQRRSVGTLNLFAPGVVSFMQVATLVRSVCNFNVEFDFRPRVISTVHRPYKATQVFRFIYNLGRQIGPVVHRPYSAAQFSKAFPDFQFTLMREAITRYVRLYEQDQLATRSSTAARPVLS
jgi:nucleoside-diphosphate-sugar epimerase